MPAWYLGLDVGGTHIDAVALGTEGVRSEAHHIRPTDILPEEAAPDIVMAFLKDLGISKKDVKAVALGWKHGRNRQRSLEMTRRFAKAGLLAHVYWDAETAFVGALPSKVGVIVLSGTGSVVYGQTSKGKVISSGGWSPLLGDPGSAFSIGQQAVIAALRASDGSGPKTMLSEAALTVFKKELNDIVVMIDADIIGAVPKIAALAPTVFTLAEAGDVEAVRIRHEAAHDLADHLLASIKNWTDKESIPVSYAGRLMYAQGPFRQLIQGYLGKEGINIQWREPQFRPPYGAILLAFPSMLEMLTQADQSLDWHH